MQNHNMLMRCCGVHGFSDMDYETDQDMINEMHRRLEGQNHGAWVLCTTTKSQKSANRRLEDIGWENIGWKRNPNSHNQVTVWFISKQELKRNLKKLKKGKTT